MKKFFTGFLVTLIVIICIKSIFKIGDKNFNGSIIQVENQRKADSLRSVIELNKKLLMIYENK